MYEIANRVATVWSVGNVRIGTERGQPQIQIEIDRPEDDTDFHHSIDALLNHRFSPALTVNLKETFRFQELPELIERGLSVQSAHASA